MTITAISVFVTRIEAKVWRWIRNPLSEQPSCISKAIGTMETRVNQSHSMSTVQEFSTDVCVHARSKFSLMAYVQRGSFGPKMPAIPLNRNNASPRNAPNAKVPELRCTYLAEGVVTASVK